MTSKLVMALDVRLSEGAAGASLTLSMAGTRISNAVLNHELITLTHRLWALSIQHRLLQRAVSHCTAPGVCVNGLSHSGLDKDPRQMAGIRAYARTYNLANVASLAD
jgi:hypothetical protein